MNYTDILINIRKIVRSINLESKKILRDYGVSIPQLLTLKYLSERDEYKAPHGEIARYLNLNSSTVTGIINRLETKGFVARLPKKNDRRVIYISLTTSGASLLDHSPRLLHIELTGKLRELPDNKLREINDALATLVDYLEIDDPAASPIITIDENILSIDESGKLVTETD